MFKADILTLPLCGVEGISHTCTHTMNIGGGETTQSIEKLKLVVQCTPTHCLLLIPGYIVNHHHFFSSACIHWSILSYFGNLTSVCFSDGSMPTERCTDYSGNLSALVKVYRHYARICPQVTALAWAQKDGPVSSVLRASQTGSMDFGADALL